jgi:hypothetical protein
MFAIIMAATFVPAGALSFNPAMLNNQDLDTEVKAHLGMDEMDGIVDADAKQEMEDQDMQLKRRSSSV